MKYETLHAKEVALHTNIHSVVKKKIYSLSNQIISVSGYNKKIIWSLSGLKIRQIKCQLNHDVP